jgi:hypothetical protein
MAMEGEMLSQNTRIGEIIDALQFHKYIRTTP